MRLFRFRGTDIVCSPLLLLALPAAFILGRGMQTAAVFASLTLHEAAHAAAAKRAGCTVASVEAQPFGFVARLNTMYSDPRDAAAVFAAGPIASLSISAAAALIARYLQPALYSLLGKGTLTAAAFLNDLASKNLLIAFINMLPALPLDGGRLILALIEGSGALKRGKRALRNASLALAAAGAAIGAAFLLAFIILMANGAFNPTFLIMGAFLVLAAVKETRREKTPLRHKRLSTRDAIAVRQIAVGQDASVAETMSLLPAGAFALISVLDASHERIGTIDESQLIKAASCLGASATMRSAVAYCRKKVL